MDVWPISLQQKLNVASFEVRMGKTTVRSDMDVGPAKVRSRFTDAIDTYTCAVNLDFSDYSTFLEFYKVTLSNGTLKFLFTDPFTGFQTVFRFADDPIIRPLGGRVFEIGMAWEKFP